MVTGRPCPACGSTNTGRDRFASSRPNILTVMLFGWIPLLIRAAFAKQTDSCRDCGALNQYKTLGSRVAMVVLLVLIMLIAISILGETDPQY